MVEKPIYKKLEQAESERKRAEKQLRNNAHDLGERIKKLNCLYGICKNPRPEDVALL